MDPRQVAHRRQVVADGVLQAPHLWGNRRFFACASARGLLVQPFLADSATVSNVLLLKGAVSQWPSYHAQRLLKLTR